MLNSKLIKSFTDLRLDPAGAAQLATEYGPVYVFNRNKPTSVLVDVDQFEAMLEELQDARDSLWLAENEMTFKKAKGISLKKLIDKYNIKE